MRSAAALNGVFAANRAMGRVGLPVLLCLVGVAPKGVDLRSQHGDTCRVRSPERAMVGRSKGSCTWLGR